MRLTELQRSILLLTILILIAYLPVVSLVFSLKNDFFTQYFPQRFFISESLKQGILPYWNPYINYGIPVYGDMNAGFWYPITWIVASLFEYTPKSFTLEALAHLLWGGFGMLYLLHKLGIKNYSGITGSISYVCSGFFIGHLQHYNWITGAAWLPWCTLTMVESFRHKSVHNLISTVLCFFMFCASSHPGIIIGGIYFFLALVLHHIWQSHHSQKIGPELITAVKILFSILALSAGIIWGYGEMLPLFNRSEPLSIGLLLCNAVKIESFLSLLIPLSTVHSKGDLALQNIYIGLLLFISLLSALLNIKHASKKIYLVIGLFFLLLSSENIVAGKILYHLPLIKFVRLPSEFRLFAIFPLIIFASSFLQKTIEYKYKSSHTISLLTGTLLLCISFYYSPQLFVLLQKFSEVKNGQEIRSFLHSIHSTQLIALQSIIMSFYALIAGLSKLKKSFYFRLVLSEVLLTTFLQLPFTGVGIRSVKEIEIILNDSPDGIPMPSLEKEVTITRAYPEVDLIIGNWSLYSKQIALEKWYPFPILTKNSQKFFRIYENSPELKKQPFIGLIEGVHSINLELFEPGKIKFKDSSSTFRRIFVKQNLYPGWNLAIDGKNKTIDTAFHTFPSTYLTPGAHKIELVFDKPMVAIFLIIQATACLILIIISLNTFFHSRY